MVPGVNVIELANITLDNSDFKFVWNVTMTGTMVMVMIATLAVVLNEGYLVDICLIYALISFLAVVVLTKVYMGVYLEAKSKKEEKEGEQSDESH